MKRHAIMRPCLRFPATCRARCKLSTDFIQTTSPDLLFRDVSLYTETISTAQQALMVIHLCWPRAAAFAGLCASRISSLPQDVLGFKADHLVTSVATLGARREIVPFR